MDGGRRPDSSSSSEVVSVFSVVTAASAATGVAVSLVVASGLWNQRSRLAPLDDVSPPSAVLVAVVEPDVAVAVPFTAPAVRRPRRRRGARARPSSGRS